MGDPNVALLNNEVKIEKVVRGITKETSDLEIRGMHCAACANRIEKVVSKIDGVEEVQVNLATEKGRVTFNKKSASIDDIIAKIQHIGFDAAVDQKNHLQSEKEKNRELTALKWQFFISALFTIPLALAMLTHFQWASFMKVPILFTNPLFQFAITIPIQFIIGYQFYERAWKSVKNGSANMDVLVVISTSAAFFYSHYLTFTHLFAWESSIILFYETSAFIITFILLGKWLEARTKMRTTSAIKELYELQTKTATVYLNGKESQLPVDKISPGDLILVKSGEKVPIDGKVFAGKSMIDESLLTGESIPVEKEMGHPVYAGTINQNGVLKIKATKREAETVLSQIIEIVEEAQGSKAPIQHIADKITGVFVPIIVLLSLVTFALSYVMMQPGMLSAALEKLIAVLIIACPCALGLATPTSVTVGSGRAARSGILFKEGKYLEVLGKSTVVILDKTGTITKGSPEVTDTYTDGSREHFYEIVGGVENASTHPIAKAIVAETKKRGLKLSQASEVTTIPGYGIQAQVNGKQVLIANPSYFRKQKLFLPQRALHRVTMLEQEGKTVMVVAIDKRYAGIIAARDTLKRSSKQAIAQLKQMGIDVIMVTGDNEETAMRIAGQTGITKVYANTIPLKKAEIIESMRAKGKKVMMVGDGINDAPALSVADIGIAIGTGSDIAMESGDITIVKGDLMKVVEAIKISQATMKNIKQNLGWAFIYNMFCIPFAMFGFLAPWLAGAVMAFSSVSVVLNSLRLQRSNII